MSDVWDSVRGTQPLGLPQSCSPLLAPDPCSRPPSTPASHLNRFPCNPKSCKKITTKVFNSHINLVTSSFPTTSVPFIQYFQYRNSILFQCILHTISLSKICLCLSVHVFAFVFLSKNVCICFCNVHRDLDEVIAAITRHLWLGHLYRSRHRHIQ